MNLDQWKEGSKFCSQSNLGDCRNRQNNIVLPCARKEVTG